nr:immunoglobulin heavy chain junction region [Mus musculus]NSM04899.1 immunoglobulin heavy chain junction region [Mus musculus]NSM06544.1 immunoglobulin heavy chain junction region [Mus musculus]NSM07298.1 immunoglobulin heavy chain junction region [Mus musculus]NSM08098.1 immunoglobulin heavy chain junction region [Mus musculus]
CARLPYYYLYAMDYW